MSGVFWPIIGYGLEVEAVFFDKAKIPEDTLLCEFVAQCIYNYTEADFLVWATTGDIYRTESVYIYYPAIILKENCRGITKEKIESTIYQLLAPWLSSKYTEEVLSKSMKVVYDCGGMLGIA